MLEELTPFLESYPFPLWEGFLRIVLAMLLGSIIGLERERRKQPAGFRTHSVLAVGSALLSIVSIYIPATYGTGVNVDPSRIASQVVSGIGFLGAGAILRMGISVKGLTTAASLWTTAGIGLATGAGMYSLSLFATVILLIVLSLMSKVEKELLFKAEKVLKVVLRGEPNRIREIEPLLEEARILRMRRSEEGIEVYLEVLYDEPELRKKVGELMESPYITSVEVV